MKVGNIIFDSWRIDKAGTFYLKKIVITRGDKTIIGNIFLDDYRVLYGEEYGYWMIDFSYIELINAYKEMYGAASLHKKFTDPMEAMEHVNNFIVKLSKLKCFL